MTRTTGGLGWCAWAAIFLYACGSDGGALVDGSVSDTGAPVSDAGASDATSGDAGSPELVFQTGFEPDTRVEAGATFHRFRGLDRSVSDHGDWDSDLVGAVFDDARFRFYVGNHPADALSPSAQLVPDPQATGGSNQVLRIRFERPSELEYLMGSPRDPDTTPCTGDPDGSWKARSQLELPSAGVARVDYRVRLRLGAAFREIAASPRRLPWMTIGEHWNHQRDGAGNLLARSRVTLEVYKTDTGEFRFMLKADWQAAGESTWTPLWEGPHLVAVPIEEWFTLEVSLQAGDATAGSPGHASVYVTTADGVRHEVADVTDSTIVEGAAVGQRAFSALHPIKVYTAGAVVCALSAAGTPLEAWWDDLAIWAR